MAHTRTALTCGLCGAPTADLAAICTRDTDAGVRTLWSLAVWVHHLADTTGRRDRINRPDADHRRGSDEQPLPINLHAAGLHTTVRRLLVSWTGRLHDARPHTLAPRHRPLCESANTWCAHPSCRAYYVDPDTAPPTLADLALELAANPRWWRFEADAPDLLHTARRTLDHIMHAIDIPPAMITLGNCDYTYDEHGDRCGAELRAPKGAPLLSCPLCQTVYDVERRRAQLLDRIEGHVLPAPVVIGIITAWIGVEVPMSTLRTWKSRGDIDSYGIDPETRASKYRIGDVRRCVLRELNEEAKKATATRQAAQHITDTKETLAA